MDMDIEEIQYTQMIQQEDDLGQLLVIPSNSYSRTIKNQALSILRFNLEHFAKTLNDLQEFQVLRELFLILKVENDSFIKNLASDAIVELMKNTKTSTISEHVLTNLSKLQKSNHTNDILNAYSILKSIIAARPSNFKQIIKIIHFGLDHQDLQHGREALKCFALYLKAKDSKPLDGDLIEDLAKIISQCVFRLVDEQEDKIGLEILKQMVKHKYIFFQSALDHLVYNLRRILSKSIALSIKIADIKLFHLLIREFPSYFSERVELINNITEELAQLMALYVPQITEEWMNPIYEIQQTQEEALFVAKTASAINYLVDNLPGRILHSLLQSLLAKFFNTNDWKYQYVGLTLVPLYGYNFEANELITEMGQPIKYFHSGNHKLRYAAIHTTGLLFDDNSAGFYNDFGGEYFTEMLQLLESDPIPRVLGHTAAALTNLLEGLKYRQISIQMDRFVSRLLYLVANGQSAIRICALDPISSLVETAQQNYAPFLERTCSLLFSTLQQESFELNNPRKAKCIEVLSIILISVGIDLFRPWLQRMFEKIIQVQEAFIVQSTYQQKQYVYFAWKRLCENFPAQTVIYIRNTYPRILTLIFRLIDQMFDFQKAASQWNAISEKTKRYLVNALQAIQTLTIKSKQHFLPFIQQTVQVLLIVTQRFNRWEINVQICHCLFSIIQVKRSEPSQILTRAARMIIKQIIDDLEGQDGLQVFVTYANALKQVCYIQYLLSQQEMCYLLGKWKQLLLGIDDFQQKQELTQRLKKMQSQMAVSKLISIILRFNLRPSLEFIPILIEKIFARRQLQQQRTSNLVFGLSLLNGLVERYQFKGLQKQWDFLASAFIKYSKSKQHSLREVACRGIGNLVSKTPSQLMSNKSLTDWLQVLYNVIENEYQSQDAEVVSYCRENVVGAVGKIISAHYCYFELSNWFNRWLRCLPLKEDVEGANIQIEILIEMYSSNGQIRTRNSDPNFLKSLLEIYGSVLRNIQIYKESVRQKIKHQLLSLQFDGQLDQTLSRSWAMLGPRFQRAINNYMQ